MVRKGPLSRDLLASIDPDAVAAETRSKLQLADDAEPSEPQLDAVEQERMREALKPFQSPKLREAVLKAKQSLEQVIDEQTRDKLLKAGFDAASKEKAQALVTSFRQYIDEHKDEIEALQLLYSQPYRAGLRYAQVKALAKELSQPPHRFDPLRLWQAYQTVEPAKVKGDGGKLVDLIALVRHALDPATPLVPVGQTVGERYEAWLAEQTTAGRKFTPDQRRWLDAIRDHVATSLMIEAEDLDEVPFNQIGGLGRMNCLATRCRHSWRN